MYKDNGWCIDMKKLLFFGDSITDANRVKLDPLDVGMGYVQQIAKMYPDCVVVNRGINGERTQDLIKRLEHDVIEEKADVVTLFIGVNDTWHRFVTGEAVSTKAFEANYRELIERIQKSGAKLILMTPFLIEVDEVMYTWREDLNAKIQIVEQLAAEYRCLCIPLDEIMKQYNRLYTKEELAGDGVHPSAIGHKIIALMWDAYYRNLK